MSGSASVTRMISAIVVTHGSLAREFIATAGHIYGTFAGVHAVSNDGKTPQGLASELEAIVEAGGPDDSYVILVDFIGGSCGHATLSVERRHRNVRVVSGVNLPMILAFLNKRTEMNFEKLPAELASRGRDSIHAIDADQF
jgi:mannose/fructose-specific phosphotransferase system component IIA